MASTCRSHPDRSPLILARPAVLREVEIGRRIEFCALAIVELEIGGIRRVFA
jgi:hypothetical protein